METIKIKSSHESQGEYVLINADDFNPEVHQLLDAESSADAPKRRGRPSKADAESAAE